MNGLRFSRRFLTRLRRYTSNMCTLVLPVHFACFLLPVLHSAIILLLLLRIPCNAVIYEDFSFEGVHQKFGCPFFWGRDKILLLGKALKCQGKIGILPWKILPIFPTFPHISPKISFFARDLGKTKNYNICICT